MIVGAAEKEAERCELDDGGKRWGRHLCLQTRLNLNGTVEVRAYPAWHHQHSPLHATKAKNVPKTKDTAPKPSQSSCLYASPDWSKREKQPRRTPPRNQAQKIRAKTSKSQTGAKKMSSKSESKGESQIGVKRWVPNQGQKASLKSGFKKVSSKSESKDEPQIRVKKASLKSESKNKPQVGAKRWEEPLVNGH
jgi:hypothetical protein